MTKILIDEATVKLVLEALKQIDNAMPFPVAKFAQAALRQALAEQPAQQEYASFAEWAHDYVQDNLHKLKPAQQEPVAVQSVMTVRIWRDKNSDQNAEFKNWHKLPDGEHILYTSPPAQRKPLTEEEFEVLLHKAKGYVHTGLMDVVRIVERHHNIKEQK